MKKKKNTGEKLLIAATVLGASYGILRAVANQKNKKNEELNKDNQYLKAEEVKAVPEKKNFYDFTLDDIKLMDYPREEIKKKNPQLKFPIGI